MTPPVMVRLRWATLALSTGGLFVVGCAADCHPFHECGPSDVRCDGRTAMTCRVESANPFMERYVIASHTCAAEERCSVVGGAARCVVGEGSCSPADSVRRCEGDHVVACTPLDPARADVGSVVTVERCGFGNVCVEGDCVVPADEACDPATFQLACREGRPTLCRALTGSRAGLHRVTFAEAPCGDGNRCVEAADFVACAISETPCDANTFRTRCDGDVVVRCVAGYARAGRGWTGAERGSTCPWGCVDSAGGGACAISRD